MAPDRNTRPDIRIDEVVDYLVNDSCARLKQPTPPSIGQFGPMKGKRMVEVGVEHTDALTKITEALVNGRIGAWGKIEIRQYSPYPFDDVLRPIGIEYWDDAKPHPVTALYRTDLLAQTVVPGSLHDAPLAQRSPCYSSLTLNRYQVMREWPRKSAWRRGWRFIVRHPRIVYPPLNPGQ
jgi:hypothetical protein